MGKRIVIPFGPQHPVLPEPIHLDLVLEDERVVEAVPSVGYVHRGLEKLVEKRDFPDYVYVAERICGICSFVHGTTYSEAVEAMMGIEVPERAKYLRMIWSELSRLHSHLLWLGCFGDAMGFENLFMTAWRLREHILDELESTTGNRVIQGTAKVGGVRRDISPGKLDSMVAGLDELEPKLRDLNRVFFDDSSVRHRTQGVGIVSTRDAYDLGAVGPTARGCGVPQDIRSSGYGAYGEVRFAPVVESAGGGGDCYTRCLVRGREMFASIEIIRQAVEAIPDGPIEVRVAGNPDGEAWVRAEQPRGEVLHYVKGNGTKHLVRHRVRTPTFAHVPFLVSALRGCEFADVPVIVHSIDPCISCTER
jgi:ech hydrogenase subunit E